MPFSGICIVLKIVVCLQLEAGVVCSGSVFYLFYFYVNSTIIPLGNTVGGGILGVAPSWLYEAIINYKNK